MRIETMTTGAVVRVDQSGETIELGLGEATVEGSSAAKLSIPQAEMVLHALGLAIAQVREQQRRAEEERQHLARVVAETEVRLR